jgi:hypothetical protein
MILSLYKSVLVMAGSSLPFHPLYSFITLSYLIKVHNVCGGAVEVPMDHLWSFYLLLYSGASLKRGRLGREGTLGGEGLNAVIEASSIGQDATVSMY